MNSLSFYLPEKFFVYPILNVNIAEQHILSFRFYLSELSMPFPLACTVSAEKSTDSIMGFLDKNFFLFLASFRVFSLSFTFVILIMVYLCVSLFGFSLVWIVWASCTQVWEVFNHDFFRYIFDSFFLSSPPGTHIMCKLAPFILSCRSHMLL